MSVFFFSFLSLFNMIQVFVVFSSFNNSVIRLIFLGYFLLDLHLIVILIIDLSKTGRVIDDRVYTFLFQTLKN